MKKQLAEFLSAFELQSSGKWFLLSTTVGVAGGLGAILFQFLGQLMVRLTLDGVAGFRPGEAANEHALFHHTDVAFSFPLLLVVLVGGGLVSGWLVYTFAPEAEGHGTDAAIDAFHNKRGYIASRVPFVKTLASAVTLGTGGSGGREGPIAQIGASFGSYLATRLKLSARDRRILLAAGMGAGVAAIFRAPLAGALFAGEILYRDADLESDAIIPSAISSIIAYSVYGFSLPKATRFDPLFGDDLQYSIGSFWDLLPLSGLAVILVLVGILYINCFYSTHKWFKRVPVKPHFRPAIGALLAGLVAWGLYAATGESEQALSVLSTGYGALQQALSPTGNTVAIKLLVIVALVKIVTTSLTIGSGGSGGVFGPSMVIGGCLGAAVGNLCHRFLPFVETPPQAFGIVGMAGFFAGCAHAPFSTIMMVSEMTGSYDLLLPTMWVSTICFLLCRKWTLYEKQVPTRLESPAHRGDFIIDVLEGIKVGAVYDSSRRVELIPESMSLDEIVHMLARTHQHYFPVVDEQQRLVGIFSEDDVRAWLYDETIWKLALARDVMVTNIVSVNTEDDLNTALRRFTALNLDELPVLDPEDPQRLLGMLGRKEAIAFYNRQISEQKHAG